MASGRAWDVREMSEQKVVKVAISHLYERFSAEQGQRELEELPTASDGAPLVKQATFFKGLLTRQFELKSIAPSDISAAQTELRHFSAAQLLSIRVRTLDFVTESASHDPHNGFLYMLDALLLEKLALDGLSRGTGCEPPRDVLREIGLKLMMVVGAAQVIAAESPAEDDNGKDAPRTPFWWAMRMSGVVSAVLIRRDDLRIHLLTKQGRGDASFLVGGESVAVVLEKAAPKPPYALDWTVRELDPRRKDIIAELHASKGWVIDSRKEMGLDLATVLQQRRYLPDSDDEDDCCKTASREKGLGAANADDEYLRTPQKGKVSAHIRCFESATASPYDPKGSSAAKSGPSPLWTMNGWRWNKAPSRLRLLSDTTDSTKASTPEQSAASHRNSPTDEELNKLAELFEPMPEPTTADSTPQSQSETKLPTPRGAAFDDKEFCGMPCLGSRSTAEGPSGIVWLMQSFKTCGSR